HQGAHRRLDRARCRGPGRRRGGMAELAHRPRPATLSPCPAANARAVRLRVSQDRGAGGAPDRRTHPRSPPSGAGPFVRRPTVFDLITTVLAAPALVPMDINIDPNDSGLPGIDQLRTLVVLLIHTR